MKTATALCCLAMALGAFASPLRAAAPPQLSSSTQCTTYITALVDGFKGHFTPTITHTVYTTTVTAYTSLVCGGCQLALTTHEAIYWGGFGPEEIIGTTVTAKRATTITSTVCAAERTPLHEAAVLHPVVRRESEEPPSPTASAEECTITQPVPQHLTFGPVKTIWTKTEIATVWVDCDGCANLQTSTVHFIGKGPAVVFTTTETAVEPTISTTYVCLATPTDSLPTASIGL